MTSPELKNEEIYTHSTPIKICVEFVDAEIGLDVARELFSLFIGRNIEVGRNSVIVKLQYAGELAILLGGIHSGHELSNYHMVLGLDKSREMFIIELEYN